MSNGIESPPPRPPEGCFGLEAAARHFGVRASQLKECTREGLLLSLKSSRGKLYYTDRDYEWIHTLRRLREEAHLSFEGIRTLLASGCTCWKVRHCDFHSKKECPVTSDPSKPCWINRGMWSVLASYPCYSCIAYRSAPQCEALRAVLNAHLSGASATAGDHGG